MLRAALVSLLTALGSLLATPGGSGLGTLGLTVVWGPGSWKTSGFTAILRLGSCETIGFTMVWDHFVPSQPFAQNDLPDPRSNLLDL